LISVSVLKLKVAIRHETILFENLLAKTPAFDPRKAIVTSQKVQISNVFYADVLGALQAAGLLRAIFLGG